MGDSATLLGLSWYGLAGYLVASVLASGDVTVSISAVSICTVLFVSLTALAMGSESLYPFRHPADFIRTGAPFLGFEVYLAISVRLLFHVLLLPRFAFLRNALRPSHLPE